MNRINDKDGVDVIIAPVTKRDGVKVNLDFNFAFRKLQEMDNRTKDWDLDIMSGRAHVARAKFSAFQFLADGVERRTIALKFLELNEKQRGKKKSYDVAEHILNVVTSECDTDWGEAYGRPTLFVEKRHLAEMPAKERSGFFGILKKIGEKVLGIHHDHDEPQPIPDHDLVVTVVGDDLSIQLIEGHIVRSEQADRPQ